MWYAPRVVGRRPPQNPRHQDGSGYVGSPAQAHGREFARPRCTPMLFRASADGGLAALRLKAPAKVNLFLEVIAKRGDGFHAVNTLMLAVSLADTLEFVSSRRRVRMACTDPDLSTGPENLVLRAAEVLRRHTGCRRGGCPLDEADPHAGRLGRRIERCRGRAGRAEPALGLGPRDRRIDDAGRGTRQRRRVLSRIAGGLVHGPRRELL